MNKGQYLAEILTLFSENSAAFKQFNGKNRTLSRLEFDAQTIWLRFCQSKDGHYVRSGHYLVDCHKHSSPEIFFSLCGELGYTDENGTELYVPQGSFCLFPAGFLHRQFHYRQSVYLGIALDIQFHDIPVGAYLSRCFQSAPYSSLPMSEQLLSTIHRLSCEIVDQRPCVDVVINNLLSLLIVEVSRSINPHFEYTKSVVTLKDSRAEELASFICSNLSAHLTQVDFETKFGMSIKQLNRIMVKYYDMSVFAFLRKERIRQVRNMLTKTNLSLKEIALSVGYSDEFTMSKAFKQIEGIPPGRYRTSYHLIDTQKSR